MKTIILFTALLNMLFVNIVQCQIYVKLGATGSNDGSSWANAYTGLQAAITAANTGDTIWVAQGSYLPTQDQFGNISPTDNRAKRFYISKNIKLFGGFAGTETALNQRNIVNNPTRLSGDLGTPNDKSDNCYNIVHIRGFSGLAKITNDMFIDGFYIENGNANGSGFDQNGGGITVDGRYGGNECSPTIQNNYFDNNNATTYGGGLFLNPFKGTVNAKIIGNTFTNNSAQMGGGIGTSVSTSNANEPALCITTLKNNVFKYNSATVGGAAAYIEEFVSTNSTLHLEIDSCTVDSNMNIAFSLKGKYVRIRNTHFVDNYNGYGVALRIACDTGLVEHCTFDNNRGYNGGAIYSARSLNLQNSIFKNNSALPGNGYGGAILIQVGSFAGYETKITNNIFTGNSAREGGAITVDNSVQNSCILTNNTFYNNMANTVGGAIRDRSTSTFTRVNNSIFWNNGGTPIHTDVNTGNIYCSHSIIQDSVDDGNMVLPNYITNDNNIDHNPLFIDAANEDFRLQNNSPAIDAGLLSTWNDTGLTTDKDGNPRPYGAGIDIGAYEALVVLGVSKLETAAKLDVFPNPSSGELTVQLGQNYENLEIQLFTLTGQLIQAQSFHNQEQLNLRIDADAGIYILKIQSAQGLLGTIKVLKI